MYPNPQINQKLFEWLVEPDQQARLLAPYSGEMVKSKEWIFIQPEIMEGGGKGIRHCNRYLYILTQLETANIHYEYIGGYVWLHIEGEYAGKAWRRQVMELKKLTREHGGLLQWQPASPWLVGCRVGGPAEGHDDLLGKFCLARDIFRPHLDIFNRQACKAACDEEYVLPRPELINNEPLLETGVDLDNLTINDIMSLPLRIPAYQRIYCWEDRELGQFWQTLLFGAEYPCHLGTVILQANSDSQGEKCLDIVDGQQRLVTLTLFLALLGYRDNLPLLLASFNDREAIEHVANAKAVGEALVRACSMPNLLEKLEKNIQFTVIFIGSQNPDLAYTFFTNQNSKGVKLSDYDLLKAHHLRFITSDAQAIHMAAKWNALSMMREDEVLKLDRSLGGHVFHLRKFLRKDAVPEHEHYLRDEFKAAPIMDEVPAFGEKFFYAEPIRGGTHFFAYAEHFNHEYDIFTSLKQAQKLRELLAPRHRHYAEMIECLLFAYYLKFGNQYLSEALFCISTALGQHRYENRRASRASIMQWTENSNLLQMIASASSPTFFMAESLETFPYSFWDYDVDETSWIINGYYSDLCALFNSLDDFSVKRIMEKIDNDY